MKLRKQPVAPTPKISINSLTLFVNATEAKKKAIVKSQKYPPAIPTNYYGPVVSALKRCMQKDFDLVIVNETIESLEKESIDPTNKQALAKRKNRISALREFLKMEFPNTFKSLKCYFSVPKRDMTRCQLGNMMVVVAPDIIIRRENNGIKYIGAIKFDVHKDALDYSVGAQRASLLSYHLETIKEQDEIVDDNYCLSVDIMHQRAYRPQHKLENLAILENTCKEVETIWRSI